MATTRKGKSSKDQTEPSYVRAKVRASKSKSNVTEKEGTTKAQRAQKNTPTTTPAKATPASPPPTTTPPAAPAPLAYDHPQAQPTSEAVHQEEQTTHSLTQAESAKRARESYLATVKKHIIPRSEGALSATDKYLLSLASNVPKPFDQAPRAWLEVTCSHHITGTCFRGANCRLPHRDGAVRKAPYVCLRHLSGHCPHERDHWRCSRVHLKPALIPVTLAVLQRGVELPPIPAATLCVDWDKLMMEAYARNPERPKPTQDPLDDLHRWGPRPCMDHIMGSCKHSKCRFAHLEGEELQAAKNRHQKGQRVKSPYACIKFLSGACKFSDAGCRCMHPEPVLKKLLFEAMGVGEDTFRMPARAPPTVSQAENRPPPAVIHKLARELKAATPLSVALNTVGVKEVPPDLRSCPTQVPQNVRIKANALIDAGTSAVLVPSGTSEWEVFVRAPNRGWYVLGHPIGSRKHVRSTPERPYYVIDPSMGRDPNLRIISVARRKQTSDTQSCKVAETAPPIPRSSRTETPEAPPLPPPPPPAPGWEAVGARRDLNVHGGALPYFPPRQPVVGGTAAGEQ